MRLIRLATQDDTAEFDNHFNTDILIPKMSKIALQNVSFELKSNFYETTGDNNLITYTVTEGGVTVEAELPLFRYNLDQLGQLREDMRVALNDSLSTDEVGLQWFVDNQGDKTRIQYKQMLFARQPTREKTEKIRTQPTKNFCITICLSIKATRPSLQRFT